MNIHGPASPRVTFCLFAFTMGPCHITLNFVLFLKAMLVYLALSSLACLLFPLPEILTFHLSPCTITMDAPSTCHFFRKVLADNGVRASRLIPKALLCLPLAELLTLHCYNPFNLLSPQCTVSSMSSGGNVCFVRHLLPDPSMVLEAV